MVNDPLLGDADSRIEQHRKADLTICISDAGGRACAGARIEVRQLRHDFRFGTIVFAQPGEGKNGEASRLLDLYNFATLPFYWKGYEPVPGRANVEKLKHLAGWCRDHGLETKGHPLVWHEAFPDWAKELPDPIARQEERVRAAVAEFAAPAGSRGSGLVECWDVINEATVADRFKTPLADWFARDGATAMVRQALTWARQANPNATLLVNDFNVSPEYEAVLEAVTGEGLCDAVGIQSHMQATEWPLERAWETCETYSRFGLPIHFTELTVVSGELKPKDTDWYTPRPNWVSTPEGEERQAEYLASLYTLLFSHPAVEAITYWGFKDPLWLNAPGGLLRADGSTKPPFDALRRLIREKWWTNTELRTSAQGSAQARVFAGEYEITLRAGNRMQKHRVRVPRRSSVTLTLPAFPET